MTQYLFVGPIEKLHMNQKAMMKQQWTYHKISTKLIESISSLNKNTKFIILSHGSHCNAMVKQSTSHNHRISREEKQVATIINAILGKVNPSSGN